MITDTETFFWVEVEISTSFLARPGVRKTNHTEH